MSRSLFEKTYPGEIPRPSVEMIKWPNDNFLMAATPWGSKDALKEISRAYSEFLTAGMADREATSPFAQLPTLSPLANTLRAATMFANEKAFTGCNLDAYASACEALVLVFEKSEMAWVQVGQPHLLIVRGGRLIPLDVAIDLGVDYEMPSPLPSRLMGLDGQIDVAVKSTVLHPGDQIVMLARSVIPSQFFTQNLTKKSGQEILNVLFEVAVSEGSRLPFWISVIE